MTSRVTPSVVATFLQKQLPQHGRIQLMLLGTLGMLITCPAYAAQMDGSKLGLLWIAPFVGILLSIALLPLLASHFWHHHYGKIALGWAAAFVIPFGVQFGWSTAGYEAAHALLLEYVPFLVLISSLFVISGGICIRGNLHGSAGMNTGLLALGTVLASIMGTVGASMLLIRPLLRANDNRKHQVHVVVFFIFLVSNVGGGLTPIGDPPLFIGFLKGVDFFWTVKWMAGPVLFLSLSLLAIFYLLDRYYWTHEDALPDNLDKTPDSNLSLLGGINFWLLGGVIAAVLMSGVWKPGININLLGQALPLQSVARDVILISLALLSLKITPKAAHDGNQFGWGPVLEVGKLFFGIFLTIIPVIAILRAGSNGALASVIAIVTNPQGQPIDAAYFWMTGLLSAFLDNAPTYLVFFNIAGGDAATLMTKYAQVLQAISAGAVFMGAMTYIGNAPNFMVNAIARERGVAMPSFFGYLGWSCVFLLPLFAVMTWIFFR